MFSHDDFFKFYFFIFTGIEYITGDNFLDMLDNGVILCQLARVIHERAQHAIDNGLHKGVRFFLKRIIFFWFIYNNLKKKILDWVIFVMRNSHVGLLCKM